MCVCMCVCVFVGSPSESSTRVSSLDGGVADERQNTEEDHKFNALTMGEV